MKNKIISLIINGPKKSLFLFLIMFLLPVSGFLLGVSAHFSPRVWFPEGDPVITQLNEFESRFQSDDSIVTVIKIESGVLNLETLKVAKEIHDFVWTLPGVSRVDSIFNAVNIYGENDDIKIDRLAGDSLTQKTVDDIKNYLEKEDNITDFLISKDRKVFLIRGGVSDGQVSNKSTAIVEKLESFIQNLKLKNSDIFTLGSIKSYDSFKQIAKEDNQKILPFVILIVSFLFIFLYKSALTLFFVYGLIGVSILGTFGLLGWFDLKYSNLLSALPGVIVAICVADAIHILESFVQKRNSSEPLVALRYSLEKNFLSTFLTSFTTAIGFASLTISEIEPVLIFGLLASSGAILAWLYTYFFIGGGLSYLINSNKLIKYLPNREFKEKKQFSFIDSYMKKINSNRKIIVLFMFVTLGSFGFYASKNVPDSDPIQYFSDGVPFKDNIQELKKHINISNSLVFEIDSGKVDGIKDVAFFKKIQKLYNWIEKEKSIVKAESILFELKKMNQASFRGDVKYFDVPESNKLIAELLFLLSLGLPEGVDLNLKVSSDYRYLKIDVLSTLGHTSKVRIFVKKFLDFNKSIGLKTSLEGNYNIYLQISKSVVMTFVKSILSALVLIALVVLVFLRSFKLALLSIIPNLFSLLTTGFFIYVFGLYLDIGTSIVGAICLGISVDDTIHFITHYKENMDKGFSNIDSIKKTLNDIGGALIVTTLILCTSFLCFLFADFVPSINFGILSSITMFCALVADLVFLPALLIIWNGEEEKS